MDYRTVRTTTAVSFAESNSDFFWVELQIEVRKTKIGGTVSYEFTEGPRNRGPCEPPVGVLGRFEERIAFTLHKFALRRRSTR